MKRLLFILLAGLCLVGCATQAPELPTAKIEAARRRILSGEAQCILIPVEGEEIARAGRGVAPLLWIYDNHRETMDGAVVCDKVIGRATAALAICGKVRHVHSELISEDAADFLTTHGIGVSATQVVPFILNRKKDGRCPMELAVAGIDDPSAAVEAMRAALKALKEQQEKAP